ncbi:MAG: cytochrome c oxidase subunit II, partial [Myxococcaceae bacterium]
KRSVIITLGIASLILFGIDGHLFVATVEGLDNIFWNFSKPEQDPNVVRIELNAQHGAWDGRYAGEDGKFKTEDDVVTWNDFKVAKDAPVVIQLTSTDVLHAFYLPNFRVKIDAVPGTVNRLTFRPKIAGQYEIGCAQHCGTHHYKMKATITVLEPDDYKKWLREASINGQRAFDSADAKAHWGWDWKS